MAEVTICRLDELPDATPRRFVLDGLAIAVVRIAADVHAVGDVCTHQNVSMSEGEVDPETCQIECWKHGSAFDLRTGHPDALPATRPLPVYPVRVVGDDVIVTIP